MKIKASIILLAFLLFFLNANSNEDKPFLAISVNIAKLLKQIPVKEKDEAQLKFILGIIETLKLKSVDLLLVNDKKELLRPIVIANMDTEAGINLFAKDPILSLFITKKDTFYKLNIQNVVAAAKTNGRELSKKEVAYLQDLSISMKDDLLIVGQEKDTVSSNKDTEKFLLNFKSPALQKLKSNNPIAAILIDMPTEIKSTWAKDLLENDLAKIELLKPVTGQFLGLLKGVIDLIKPYDQIGASIEIDKDQNRKVTYLQIMKKDTVASDINNAFTTKNKTKKNKDFLINAIDFNSKVGADIKLSLEKNILEYHFSWNQKDDALVQKKVTSSLMGLFFKGMGGSSSSGFKATEGDLTISHRQEPNLKTKINFDEIKKEVIQLFKSQLHVWAFFSFGDKPSVSLQLEPIYLPMSELAVVKFKIIGVYDKNNKNFHDPKRKSFRQTIPLFSKYTSTISLNVLKGTKKTDLATAKIDFNIEYPSKFQKVEFLNTDKIGTVKKSDQVEFTLKLIDRDVCTINANNNKNLFIFAYDKKGKCLSSSTSFTSADSASHRFSGEIHKIIAIAIQETTLFSFQSIVNLNEGKDASLPKNPTENPPVRYELNIPKQYINISLEDLKSLKVKWNMDNKNKWKQDNIEISLKNGPVYGDAQCESHFFAKNQPVTFKSRTGFHDNRQIRISLEKRELKMAQAVYGKIKFDLRTDIETIVLDDLTKKNFEKVLKNGKKVAVTCNQNQLIIVPNGLKILSLSGYDKYNLRLRHTFGNSSKRGQSSYLFYGIPKKIEIQFSGKKIDYVHAFEDFKGEVNKASYESFKNKIEREKEIVKVLNKLGKDFNWMKSKNPYGIASLYYIEDRYNKKKPIGQKIAHSDPMGALIFGYKTKPYLGYYFTCAKGTYEKDVNTPYALGSKEKTYKTEKGEIKAIPFKKGQTILAIPAQKGLPAFYVKWSNCYRLDKYNGGNDAFIPKNTYNDKKWLQVKYIFEGK
ncbi:MAG: hypothetical protein COA79_08870 [Planctomycetota bacterium]|nr:MAG: hypothetical protein COA79_08870 [Planctomycetota bacterium]